MAGRERVVSFSIKARDGYSAQMKAATAALDRFRSAQERTSKHRESVQAEKQAIDALRASYKEAADRVARYGEALGRSAKTAKLSIAEERELREEIAGTRARMADLTTEINKRTAALSRMSAVQRAQSAAARNDTAVTALRKEAEAARAAADALRAKEAAHKAAVKAALSRRDDATPVTGTGGGSPVGRIDQDRARMASTRDEAVRLNAEMARLRTSTAVPWPMSSASSSKRPSGGRSTAGTSSGSSSGRPRRRSAQGSGMTSSAPPARAGSTAQAGAAGTVHCAQGQAASQPRPCSRPDTSAAPSAHKGGSSTPSSDSGITSSVTTGMATRLATKPTSDSCWKKISVSGTPWNTLASVEWRETNSGTDGVRTYNEGVHLARLRWGRVTQLIICPDTAGLLATLDRLALAGNSEAKAEPIVD